jgi:hypothetical protein
MRPFEVSFLVFEAHALAQKLIDDGVVVVVPPLIEVTESERLVLISRHQYLSFRR